MIHIKTQQKWKILKPITKKKILKIILKIQLTIKLMDGDTKFIQGIFHIY